MYKGYRKITLSDEQMASFYQNPNNFIIDAIENEYILVENNNNEVVDYFITKNGILEKIGFPQFDSSFCGKMKPRNAEQRLAMDLILREGVPIKVVTGRFGSGKTVAMINGAMHHIQRNKFDKIIYIRNNIQVKDTDPLGALPGLI